MRWTEGVVGEVLPNGLTVLVQRDPGATVAAVVTHVQAGYFDEPDEWVGISHVVEHMYFKGTARRGVSALAREIRRAGGYLNASTIYDRTQYYAVVPVESLAEAIELESDALLHAALDPDELAREIEVIVQEVKRKLDTPGAVVAETLYGLLFDRHRMRRWRMGTEEELRRLRHEDVVAYYRSRYVPRRIVVAVVAGTEPSDTLAQVRDAFGAMPDLSPADNPSPLEPEHTGFRTRWLHGDVRRAVLALGWRTFGPLDPRAPALDLAATVLAEGRGSWGYGHLRAPGIATALSGAHYTPTEVGVFHLGAETDQRGVGEALQRLWAIVHRLRTAGPSEADLERARALIATDWARRFETAAGRATALAEFEALGGYALADRYYQQVLAVSAEQVREAAASLALERSAVVGYLPDGIAAPDDAGELERRLANARPAEVGAPAPVAPAVAGGVPGARTRRMVGTAVLASGGVEAIALRKAGAPLVALGAVLVGPRAAEGPTVAGSSLLTARAALRAAGPLDRDGLAVAAERLGGSLVTVLSPDWVGWRLSVRSDGLARGAQLLGWLATQAALDDAAVAIERDLLEREIQHAADDMMRHPMALALRAGFGDDPYGQPGLGTAQSVARLNGPAVRRWYHEVMQRGAVVVAAVGDLEPEAAVEQLAAAYPAWPGTRRDGIQPGVWLVGRGEVEQREKHQTAMVLAFPTVARRSPDRYAVEVLLGVVNGMGGRLFEAVREARALAYAVSASPWLWQRAGVVLAYLATAPARAAEARDVALEELRRLNRAPISVEELEEAARYAVGMLRVRRQSGVALLADLIEAHVAGGSIEELRQDETGLLAVTAADVVAAAQVAFSGAPTVGMIEGRV